MRVVLALAVTDLCQVTGADRYDLHANARAIERIETARTHPPLRAFLAYLNDRDSLFTTFGCKVWSSVETGGAEPCIFASRVDLMFLSEATNLSPDPLENVAKRLDELLEREPGDALRVELRLAPTELTEESNGYCLRLHLFARGARPEQAQVRWGLGLARLQQALLFVARTFRQQTAKLN